MNLATPAPVSLCHHEAFRGLVPPPLTWERWRWTACKPSPQQRERHRHHRIVLDILACVIGTLNWLALGSPLKCPPGARAGAPLSDAQHAMCQNLERHIRYFLSAGPFEGQMLGCCEEKFSHLLRSLQELPCIAPAITDVDLAELVCLMQSEIDPYGRSDPEGILPRTNISPSTLPDPPEPGKNPASVPPAFSPAASGSADSPRQAAKPAKRTRNTEAGRKESSGVGVLTAKLPSGPLGKKNGHRLVHPSIRSPKDLGPFFGSDAQNLPLRTLRESHQF